MVVALEIQCLPSPPVSRSICGQRVLYNCKGCCHQASLVLHTVTNTNTMADWKHGICGCFDNCDTCRLQMLQGTQYISSKRNIFV